VLEIEVKYPLNDLQSLETRLQALGARQGEQRSDADHYLNAPDRDFAQTDEAFRLRCIGERNLLTYKGPKIDRATKTRREIEVECAAGAAARNDLLEMYKALGYRAVAVVCKNRRIYDLERGGFSLEICLDEVRDVGNFAEIEIMAEESKLAAAKAVLAELAAELGLTHMERRSYLEMFLASKARK
jgi:adenylate cyclase class 2